MRSRNIFSWGSASGTWRLPPDEKYLLTTNGVSNDVSIIDVANLRVIKTIQVGELPWGIAISQQ